MKAEEIRQYLKDNGHSDDSNTLPSTLQLNNLSTGAAEKQQPTVSNQWFLLWARDHAFGKNTEIIVLESGAFTST
jgi:hypothetical protein